MGELRRRRSHVSKVLREADVAVRAAPPGDYLHRYDVARVAAGVIAPVDIFTIGLVDENDQTTAFPYFWLSGAGAEEGASSDGAAKPASGVRDGGVFPYGPRGLTSWLLASRRSYRWSDDGGALVRMGWPVDGAPQVADVVAAPMLRDGCTVGFLVAQSKAADVYDDAFVYALERLAVSLVAAQLADDELFRGAAARELYPEQVDWGEDRAAILNWLSEQLLVIREGLEEATPEAAVVEAMRRCDALRAEAMTRSFTARHRAAAPSAPDPMSLLTPRERAVAQALLDGDDTSTAALARRLLIAPDTVKSHLKSIMRKTGARSRAELPWLLRQQAATPPLT